MGSLFSSPTIDSPSAEDIRAKDQKDRESAAQSVKEGANANLSRVSRQSLVQPGLYIPPAN